MVKTVARTRRVDSTRWQGEWNLHQPSNNHAILYKSLI